MATISPGPNAALESPQKSYHILSSHSCQANGHLTGHEILNTMIRATDPYDGLLLRIHAAYSKSIKMNAALMFIPRGLTLNTVM